MILVDGINNYSTGHYMKKSIFGNFGLFETNLGIKCLEKVFDFFKAHIKRQLLVAVPFQESNFNVFA